MLIAHIADPLIGAVPDIYLTEALEERWQADRIEAFCDACSLAAENRADLILLTGKLFAEGYLTDAVIAQVLECIRSKEIPFVWKADETGRQYLQHQADMPSNLHLLDDCRERDIRLKGVCISVRSGRMQGPEGCTDRRIDTGKTAELDSENCCILIAEGEEDPAQIRRDVPEVRYIAAGRWNYIREAESLREHDEVQEAESSREQDEVQEAGKPRECSGFKRVPGVKLENTGFEDPDNSGYMLLEAEGGEIRSFRKVSAAVHRYKTLFVELDREDDLSSVQRKCAAAGADLTGRDLVRILLTGGVDVEAFIRTDLLEDRLRGRFFYLEMINDCRLELDEAAFAGDISLKGEFIRTVLEDDSLSESEKSRIIQCGWNALQGKELPE